MRFAPVMLLALVGLLAGCGQQQAGLAAVPLDVTPQRLSEWQLFSREGDQLRVRSDAMPYTLATPLFTDYASKLRTVYLPPGKTATVDDSGTIAFPVGTVITKTFYYPRPKGELIAAESGATVPESLDLGRVRPIETRLLVHRDQGWEALPYVWLDDGSDARLAIAGDIKPMVVSHGGKSTDFSYVVPTRAECASCHVWNHTTAKLRPIGPNVRHLARSIATAGGVVSQLDRWVDAGLLQPFDADPFTPAAVWPPAPGENLEHAARTYLDINCGHCHSPIGPADTSGLFLHFGETSLRRLGACKQPIAAGRGSGGLAVSIMPGQPEASIMHFRMQSTDPGQMMPEIGRSLVHREGVALIGQWIREMEGECVAQRASL